MSTKEPKYKIGETVRNKEGMLITISGVRIVDGEYKYEDGNPKRPYTWEPESRLFTQREWINAEIGKYQERIANLKKELEEL